MATKLKNMQVVESENKRVASVPTSNAAGSGDITFFVYQSLPRIDGPFLKGEEYPALVEAWDNEDDKVFDTL